MTETLLADALTACLIVRDEADCLSSCLSSLRDAGMSNICVLDTGSTDGTLDIAERYGARTGRHLWSDDFAAARNVAVAMAATPWVLSIDADETFSCDAPSLAAHLRRAVDIDMFSVELADVRDGRIVSRSPIGRLFRPLSVHFTGRVHEVLQGRTGQRVRSVPIPPEVCGLTHTGYDVPARDARRHHRNLRLAHQEVADRRAAGQTGPLVMALVNLGRARSAAGSGAVDGVEEFLEAWALDAGGPFQLWAGELAASGLAEAGRGREVAPILRELAVRGSNEAQLAWLASKVFSRMGRISDQLTCLRHAEGRATAMGEVLSDEMVLANRLNAELHLGLLTDAEATAARLAGGHCRQDALRTYLVLSAGKSEDVIGGTLSRFTPEADRPQVREALEGHESVSAGVLRAFDQ